MIDIQHWPLDRIMQLPDHCFGRRFPVCLCPSSSSDVPGWDISEIALPETCVIWDLVMWVELVTVALTSFRLALGDQLPTTTAQMDALDPLFPGLGHQGAEPRQVLFGAANVPIVSMLRLPVRSGGRRPVAEVIVAGPDPGYLDVILVVSSIPTEVPDWLISGRDRRP